MFEIDHEFECEMLFPDPGLQDSRIDINHLAV
jgi:hypothetical protein